MPGAILHGLSPWHPRPMEMPPDHSATEGVLVPAGDPADIRYEDEQPADAVTRVVVRVERADGTVKEYEAREPRDFTMNDPERIFSMAFHVTGLSIGHTSLRHGASPVQPAHPQQPGKRPAIPGSLMSGNCSCECHVICSCDLGLSLGAWRCRKHEDAHCRDCRDQASISSGSDAAAAGNVS